MSDAPRPLEQWLAVLAPLQLPLDSQIKTQALAAIDRACSAGELGALLLDDPAAVVLLLGEANRALARHEREAHGLEHAIGLLGMTRVRKLLKEAPALALDHPFTREYRQAQQRSQHAAWQARLWAEGSGRWPADEMFWDTLLAGAPHWALWLEAGPQRLQLSKLRAEHGFITAAHSRELFGCDLTDLMAQLTDHWHLPRNSRLAWRRDVVGRRREWIGLARAARLEEAPALPTGRLNELSQQPCLIVALANLLAVEADWDWESRHFDRLLRIAASCCRRPLATLSNFVHQTAALFSRQYRGELQTPAHRLLCHWQQAEVWGLRRPRPAPATAPTSAAPTPATKASQPMADDAVFAAARQRLQQSGAGMRDALTLMLDALRDGVGLARIAALLYRGESRELQTLLSRGLDSAPALRQLRVPLQPDTLLDQLLRKPACLRLGGDNAARFLPLLPASLRAAMIDDQLLLGSVLSGTRPLALLVADNGGGPISDEQYQRFRQLNALLGQCLARLERPL